MKVCVIYDRKGNCPVFATVVPHEQIFIRDLQMSCKNDKQLVYSSFPEDYQLFVSADPISSGSFSNVIPFTDFIKKSSDEEDSSNG